MKIAILGTRGVPNNHGGFEQFAEYFSVYLAQQGHEVYVYNSHDHPYQQKLFKDVHIVHCQDPEHRIGTIGQFIYDFNCIRDSRKRDLDVILQLGYTSNSIWYWQLPKKPVIITNMDGMEWKRSKYKPSVRKFLKLAERLAVKSSDFLISDSVGIQDYIEKTYNRSSEFIAYGASVFSNGNNQVLSTYKVKPNHYCLIIARMEPENNIETIVEGHHLSTVPYDLIIFGSLNAFGEQLKAKYSGDARIRFVGSNYNQEELNNLRFFSRYYYHGHSVGGTNPSLLEAMASNALIIAHNNIFNKSILGADALYFETSHDIEKLLNDDSFFSKKDALCGNNTLKIQELYDWEKINRSYENFISSKLKN